MKKGIVDPRVLTIVGGFAIGYAIGGLKGAIIGAAIGLLIWFIR